MAWCKTNISDFFGWNFFFFKSAWILACAFQFSRKTFPCICLPILHLVSEKNKDKISRHAQWTQQGGTRENILFGSFVSMCWCGASDQSASTHWIISFRVLVQIVNFSPGFFFFVPSVCSSFVRGMFYY